MRLGDYPQHPDEHEAQPRVIGPCPGCDAWQLDIVEGNIPWPAPYQGSTRTLKDGSLTEWITEAVKARSRVLFELIEEALVEHADTCDGLRIILLERES